MIISLNSGQICPQPDFDSEIHLQDTIQQHPKVLTAISKMNKQEAPPLILKREFSVQSGAIDFLATDSEENIYIIETKLAQNPEIRRAVIGQVLEYASNLRDMPYESFHDQCSKALGKNLESAIKDFYTDFSDFHLDQPEVMSYGKQLRENLEKGRFSMVIVANNVNLEIQRLLNFIDEFTSPDINFIVLEVNRYEIDHGVYVHSNVLWAAKYIRSLYSRQTISEKEYISSKSEHVQKVIAFIDSWCAERNLSKTSNSKGISWKSDAGGSIFVSDDKLDTNWATIHVSNDELDDFKKKQMDLGRQNGFQIRTTKAGGIRAELSDSLELDTVRSFLNISYSVLKLAQEMKSQNYNN